MDINSKVFIKTTDGRIYSGIILSYNDQVITIIDKYDAVVELQRSYCVIIQEEK